MNGSFKTVCFCNDIQNTINPVKVIDFQIQDGATVWNVQKRVPISQHSLKRWFCRHITRSLIFCSWRSVSSKKWSPTCHVFRIVSPSPSHPSAPRSTRGTNQMCNNISYGSWEIQHSSRQNQVTPRLILIHCRNSPFTVRKFFEPRGRKVRVSTFDDVWRIDRSQQNCRFSQSFSLHPRLDWRWAGGNFFVQKHLLLRTSDYRWSAWWRHVQIPEIVTINNGDTPIMTHDDIITLLNKMNTIVHNDISDDRTNSPDKGHEEVIISCRM